MEEKLKENLRKFKYFEEGAAKVKREMRDDFKSYCQALAKTGYEIKIEWKDRREYGFDLEIALEPENEELKKKIFALYQKVDDIVGLGDLKFFR